MDIFTLLSNVDGGNRTFYSSLSDEDKKKFVPFVDMKWMSSGSAYQLMALNEFVNPYVFSLQAHKELLYQLFVACSDGKSKRYNWAKQNKKHPWIAVVKEIYQCSEREAIEYIPLLRLEQVTEYAERLGYDAKQLKTIKDS